MLFQAFNQKLIDFMTMKPAVQKLIYVLGFIPAAPYNKLTLTNV